MTLSTITLLKILTFTYTRRKSIFNVDRLQKVVHVQRHEEYDVYRQQNAYLGSLEFDPGISLSLILSSRAVVLNVW